MQNIQQIHKQFFIDVNLTCNNSEEQEKEQEQKSEKESEKESFLHQDVKQQTESYIPNGYSSTKQKVYKREYKNRNDIKIQPNKLLLYYYKHGHDPCYKRYSNRISFIKPTNVKLYQDSSIFGLNIIKSYPLYLKRLNDLYLNMCGLLVEHNDYKDKTKGKMTNIIKSVRFDLRYPISFTTVRDISHTNKDRKYKSYYTKRFSTHYITLFNKLLLHWLKYNFERYMVVYNTEYRKEHDNDTALYTAKNPHHHVYVFFSSKYTLKEFFNIVNTFWCTALNIPLPANKRTGYIEECRPKKKQPWFKFVNANGLILDESKDSFTNNFESIFYRASYLCKRVEDNKEVDLGKQFNIINDKTTQKYVNAYKQYILPVYYV